MISMSVAQKVFVVPGLQYHERGGQTHDPQPNNP